jgi:hypothetical protein
VGGWFVSIDASRAGQSRLARFFLRRDPRQFVRKRDEYLGRLAKVFPRVEKDEVRHDLMLFLNTDLILRCPVGADT